MTSAASSTSADALAACAIEGRGEWSLGPVEALRRIVPDLGQDLHKGQVKRHVLFSSKSVHEVQITTELALL